MKHSFAHWKRLLSTEAIPGWAILGWKLLGALSTFQYIKEILSPCWKFISSPAGNIVLILCGLAWLAAVVFRPRLNEALPAIDPIPVPSSPEITWADKIEADDANNLNLRIVIADCEPELHFGAKEPYVDFKLTFVNATVFHLISEK